MKIGDNAYLNFVPTALGNPKVSDGQDNVNFIPEKVQSVFSGRYVQDFSMRNLALRNLPDVDRFFTAGENLSIGDAVGFYGEVLDVTHSEESAGAATYVDADNANTNYDGTNPLTIDMVASVEKKRALVSWTSLPDVSGTISGITGATLLSIEINFKIYITANTGTLATNLRVNTGSFTEGSVTWNTKPSLDATTISLPTADISDAPKYIETGWTTIDSGDYSNLRSNGLSILRTGNTGSITFSDEDQSNPPLIQVRYTYKVQNGEIYKVNATTAEYANSFIGFSTQNIPKGGRVKVRLEGKVPGFTGLTAYSTYYLSDTDGSISTSAGTTSKIVGRSISTTELQAKYQVT